MRTPLFQSYDQKKSGSKLYKPTAESAAGLSLKGYTSSRINRPGSKGKNICFRFINIRFVVGYGNVCEFVIFL